MAALPASPLPLAGEVDRQRRSGGGYILKRRRKRPLPDPPRKREREFTFLRRFGGELLALFDRLFDGADHVEGSFGQVIVFAFAEIAEALDGVGEIDELAGRAGEDFGNVERLRQESLDLAG